MLNNLAQLHTAILAGLRAQLPDVPEIAAYPDIRRRVAGLPAIIVELSDLEPGADPGTGETALIGRFSAFVVVDPNRTDAQMQVRELSARLAAVLRGADWGLPIGIARFSHAGEDGMNPDLDGYLVWAVEWTHEFTLPGASP